MLPSGLSHFAPFWVIFYRSSSSLVAVVWKGWHQLWFAGCTEEQKNMINDFQYITRQELQMRYIQTHAEVSLWSRNSLNNLWQLLWISGNREEPDKWLTAYRISWQNSGSTLMLHFGICSECVWQQARYEWVVSDIVCSTAWVCVPALWVVHEE